MMGSSRITRLHLLADAHPSWKRRCPRTLAGVPFILTHPSCLVEEHVGQRSTARGLEGTEETGPCSLCGSGMGVRARERSSHLLKYLTGVRRVQTSHCMFWGHGDEKHLVSVVEEPRV